MTKIINHPLIAIKLTKLRDVNTKHFDFRKTLTEASSLMIYDVLNNYQGKDVNVLTPNQVEANGLEFDKEIVLVPILRAGLGMVDGILNVLPEARVGHIGLYRDEETARPIHYYFKMPEVGKDSLIIVLDPMLATGYSASQAIDYLKQSGFTNIKALFLLASQTGVELLEKNHPDVEMHIVQIDERLNDKSYIIPGLGDAGDRVFGTKE